MKETVKVIQECVFNTTSGRFELTKDLACDFLIDINNSIWLIGVFSESYFNYLRAEKEMEAEKVDEGLNNPVLKEMLQKKLKI